MRNPVFAVAFNLTLTFLSVSIFLIRRLLIQKLLWSILGRNGILTDFFPMNLHYLEQRKPQSHLGSQLFFQSYMRGKGSSITDTKRIARLTSAQDNEEEELSVEQKLCLQHILRNVATALSCVIASLEQRQLQLTPKTVSSCLEKATKDLNYATKRLSAGSGCALKTGNCSDVARFVGCPGVRSLSKKKGTKCQWPTVKTSWLIKFGFRRIDAVSRITLGLQISSARIQIASIREIQGAAGPISGQLSYFLTSSTDKNLSFETRLWFSAHADR